MSNAYWEHFEHKADIGVRGFGNTLAEAFEQAAVAMTTVVADISLVQATTSISIACSDDDNDALLYDWLNALIYEMATRKMLFCQFEVSIDHGKLEAAVFGEAIDIERHQPCVEIKGATFTELAVYQEGQQWIAQCVIDV
jgi:tRNA nucleotidyltransferase (CCA-adding enzyme)